MHRPHPTIARPRFWTMLAAIASMLVAAMPAAAQNGAGARVRRAAPDSVVIGRNGTGEPCTASRDWTEQARGEVPETVYVYAIICRNDVAASRVVGKIHIFEPNPAVEQMLARLQSCGAESTVAVRGLGNVRAQRCADARFGGEAVSIRYRKGRDLIIASAVPAVTGPLEEALRVIVDRDRPTPDSGGPLDQSIKSAALAAPPAAEMAAMVDTPFDPAIALQQGVAYNHKGLHVDASRVLNDALSRLPANAPAATRVELLLEAGLADSNIRFADSARDHFDRAAELLRMPALADNGFLIGKADTYRALDLLNRRQYNAALAALDRLAIDVPTADVPLLDPMKLRKANERTFRPGDVGNAVTLPDISALKPLVVNAQAQWARSFALLALGKPVDSAAALARARADYDALRQEPIDPGPIAWLGARIDRQAGRLLAADGKYDEAVAMFDRALAGLRLNALQTTAGGAEPAVAETLLERAGIIAQRGGDPAMIRREYDMAIDAVIASGASNVNTVGLERYLDLLAADPPSDAASEHFFKALQAVGEPDIARQISQLREVVASDPALGVKIRDRNDLATQIRSLGNRIFQVESKAEGAAGETPVAELRRQLAEAQAKLDAVETILSANPRYNTVDEKPATIAEIRALLKPDEVFFKLSALNRRAFGVVISAGETVIYPVKAPLTTLETLARCVRFSIDGGLKPASPAFLDKISRDCGKNYRNVTDRTLVDYDVSAASLLYSLITDAAADKLTAAASVIVDPAGPLESLPLGVLVTDGASAERYRQRRATDPANLSDINFLARRAAISTALSPRSFVVARKLPPSRATNPFIGFASPSAPADVVPDVPVNVGFGCPATANLLRNAWRNQPVIPDTEILYAVGALGLTEAPLVDGAAFTDAAIAARGDLNQYEVLHFATHGFEEGVWGCPKSPPALMTSFGDADSDGLLSFSEVAALNLDANLVVLSACDTSSGIRSEALARASGQEQVGSTLEGLVRAFLTANSRAVMATHWEIANTEQTENLIGDFYAAARNQPIGVALRTAQTTLMNSTRFSHPFYWGAFFVVGDSTKMMLSPPATAQMVPAAAGMPAGSR